jgi:enoyl-CoA hydratase/carnithine racemase
MARHGCYRGLLARVAHSICCGARGVFDAAEGYRIGFVDRLVPHETLLDETKAYLRELAANVSPNSLAVIKSEVYRHWSLAMESAFRDADGLMKVTLMHPDATEGVKSFVERRAPRFKRIRGEEP